MATQPVTLMSRPKPAQIDTITIDASVSETHTLANTVTDHPVEEGGDISDHSRPEPDGLTMECVISNTPLSTAQQQRRVQFSPASAGAGGAGVVQIVTTAQQAAPQNSPGYAESAFAKLKDLRDAGVVMKVITGLRTYDSMAITSISIPRDSKTRDALRFSITFKRIKVVKNKLTRSVVAKDPRAGGKVKTGNQVPQAPEKESSALFSVADSAAKSGNGTLGGFGKFILSGGQ